MRIKTGINEIRTHCAQGAAIPQRSLPFSFSNTESRAVSSIDFGSASVKPRSGQEPIGGAPPVGLKAWKTFFYIIAAEAKSVKGSGASLVGPICPVQQEYRYLSQKTSKTAFA